MTTLKTLSALFISGSVFLAMSAYLRIVPMGLDVGSILATMFIILGVVAWIGRTPVR
ncbi:hypothetical protein [Kolteria novifilia]|uniref:hypothetical protein n=1 Tax=Kolteria novifilia TaxID=2527975 RepID=UPI003AF350D1